MMPLLSRILLIVSITSLGVLAQECVSEEFKSIELVYLYSKEKKQKIFLTVEEK